MYDVPTTSEESSGRCNYYEETTVEYSTIPDGPYDTPDTSNEGAVYSAVVVKDDKKTQENRICPGNKQEATEVLYDLPTITNANDHTHYGNKNAPPIFIYSTIDEEGAPDDYTEINDTVNNTIHVDENPAYASSTTKGPPNKDKTILCK